MTLPKIASREEWRAARVALLADEKALTKQRDAVNTKRRELPMVEVDTDYRFEGPDGEVGLADLFEGRPQLIVYHFMFHPEWEEGCPSCTAGVDEVSRGYDSYNYRTLDEWAAMGQESMRDSPQPYDMPGQSCFLRVDDRIFHTYSVYGRGLESLGGSYYFLDNTALGRQEDWEEPKGRSRSVRGNTPDFAS
jgi:predicted dithiol-disulfide oxidoreductase (DUF899 family)